MSPRGATLAFSARTGQGIDAWCDWPGSQVSASATGARQLGNRIPAIPPSTARTVAVVEPDRGLHR